MRLACLRGGSEGSSVYVDARSVVRIEPNATRVISFRFGDPMPRVGKSLGRGWSLVVFSDGRRFYSGMTYDEIMGEFASSLE